MAQLGSAPALGAGGRWFKSSRPDNSAITLRAPARGNQRDRSERPCRSEIDAVLCGQVKHRVVDGRERVQAYPLYLAYVGHLHEIGGITADVPAPACSAWRERLRNGCVP